MADVMGNAWMVVLVGLVVVFAVLILLVAIIWVAGKVISGTADQKAGSTSDFGAMPQVAGVQHGQTPADTEELTEELLAVIAAAVAVVTAEDPSMAYTIRSVRRAGEGRPVWAAAGIMESTRPF